VHLGAREGRVGVAGRIRTIKPELLDDERTSGLSDAGFRLFVSLILLADDHGAGRAGRLQLHAATRCGRGDPEITARALEELAVAGLVTVYSVRGQRYAHLRGWKKHQRIDKPSKPRVPQPDDQDAEIDHMEDRQLGAFSSETLARGREDVASVAEALSITSETLATDHDLRSPISDLRPRPRVRADARTPAPKKIRAKKEGTPPPQLALDLAIHLRDAILSHSPDAKIPKPARRLTSRDPEDLTGWARDMDLAMRLDGRTAEQLRRAIDWVHRKPDGEWWRPNVLSAGKLRAQYDQLAIQARRGRPGAAPVYDRDADDLPTAAEVRERQRLEDERRRAARQAAAAAATQVDLLPKEGA